MGIAALVLGTMACGREASERELAQPDGTMIVRGTTSSALGVTSGRAVAIGTDGRKFWTNLDRDGDFTLKLPVGQSYRILIAQQLASGALYKVIGHVIVRAGAATATRWIGANEAGVVDLGRIRVAQSTTTLSTRTGGACSGCADGDDDDDDDDSDDDDRDSDADHDDDDDCHESTDDVDDDDADDDDDDCKVCKDGSDKDLSPAKDPGSKCADTDDHDDDKDDGDDDACPSGSGGGASSPAPDAGSSD